MYYLHIQAWVTMRLIKYYLSAKRKESQRVDTQNYYHFHKPKTEFPDRWLIQFVVAQGQNIIEFTDRQFVAGDRSVYMWPEPTSLKS